MSIGIAGINNTNEIIGRKPVTTWLDDTVLNEGNESQYLGGLFRKNPNGGYVALGSTGAFPISRLTTVSVENVQKLINDLSKLGGGEILFDKNLNMSLETDLLDNKEGVEISFQK